MKKLIILILSIIIVQFGNAQQDLYFMGGVANDQLNDAIIDEEGNVYIIGSYEENLDSRDDRLTSVGGIDIFIGKFDRDMNRTWMKSMGGAGSDIGKSISMDQAGNLFIMSTFTDSIIVNKQTFKSRNKRDILISSMDKEGNIIWTRQLPAKGNFEGIKLANDNKGNIYGILSFSENIELGAQKFKATSGTDALLFQMGPKGNIVWSNHLGGLYDNVGASVSVDNDGNVYFVGNFAGKVRIAGGDHVVDGNSDMFLIKYHPTGKMEWVKRSKGEDVNRVNGMAVDNEGNIYLTGSFERTISFDAERVSSASDKDMFLVKYGPEGNVEWLRYAAGGFAHDRGKNVGIDPEGNIYVTGTYTGSITFIEESLDGTDSRQMFLAKYSPEGAVINVTRAGGVSTKNSLFVLPSSDGVIAAGEFDEEGNFGDISFENQGGRDLFLWRME